MKDMLRMVVWVLFGLVLIAAVQGCSAGQLRGPGEEMNAPVTQDPGQAMIDQATATGGLPATENATTKGEAQPAAQGGALISNETYGSNFFPPDNQPDIKGFVDTQAFTNSMLWSENFSKDKEVLGKIAKVESKFGVNFETITGILFGCKKKAPQSANESKEEENNPIGNCDQFSIIVGIDGGVDLSVFEKEFHAVDQSQLFYQLDPAKIYYAEPNYLVAFPVGKNKNVVIFGTKEYVMYAANNLKQDEYDSLKTGFLLVAFASFQLREFDIFKTPLQQFKTMLTAKLVNEVFNVDFSSPITAFTMKFNFKDVDYVKLKKFIVQKFEDKEDKEEIESPEDRKKNIDTN